LRLHDLCTKDHNEYGGQDDQRASGFYQVIFLQNL
jgi:hypothetical protein